MRKRFQIIVFGLLSLILLSACHSKKENTMTSSSITESSSTSTSTSTAVKKEISPLYMDIDALMQGNYDSIIGTWQNSHGDTLVFNSKGLVDEKRKLLGRGKITQGVFEIGYVDAEEGEVEFLMTPKEVGISNTLLAGEADTTDRWLDRIVIKMDRLDEAVDAYYRLSTTANSSIDPLKNTETGVQLESGPKTIDYANHILGENDWKVTEGNYTRTEAIPYNVLEGNDNSRYTVYQNGVILNSDYKIVYQP